MSGHAPAAAGCFDNLQTFAGAGHGLFIAGGIVQGARQRIAYDAGLPQVSPAARKENSLQHIARQNRPELLRLRSSAR
jgi:hypothetical protein